MIGNCGVLGCMDALACNYDAAATMDDGSCTYAAAGFDCAGNCLNGGTSTTISNREVGSWGNYSLTQYGGTWSLTDATGAVLASDADGDDVTLCLPDGCYDLVGNSGSGPSYPWGYDINGTGTYTVPGAAGTAGGSAQFTVGAGVCTVLGCTDPTAFNYDSSANIDDGSCSYNNDTSFSISNCDSYTWNDTVYTQSGTYSYTVPASGSGGVSSGPFIGLSLESYATKPTGETVYRLYADLDSANHTLFGLSGTAIHALTVNTTTSFFQDQFGGDIQTDINSSFIGQPFLPDLIYDSWWTLGDSYDNTPVAKLGDWTFGTGNFSLGGSTATQGTIARVPTDAECFGVFNASTGTYRVLLGQFTTDGDVSGYVNLEGNNAAQNNSWNAENIAFSSTGGSNNNSNSNSSAVSYTHLTLPTKA